MKKIRYFLLGAYLFVSFFTFFTPAFSQTETITIATYYPSPVGVYRELRSQRMAIGATYFDGGQFCWGGGCTNQVGNTVDLAVEGAVTIGNHTVASDQIQLQVTDPNKVNAVGEYVSLVSIVNPNQGTGDPVAGAPASDSVAALLLHARNSRWQLRSDEFSSTDGIFRIHEEPIAETRLAIRKTTGNVGIGTLDPEARLDVRGGVRVGDDETCNADKTGTLRYRSGGISYCDGSQWTGMGAWPSGHYCIIQAQGNACPAGFSATDPSQSLADRLGRESDLVAGGPASRTSNANRPWVMDEDRDVSWQRWAWCCK